MWLWRKRSAAEDPGLPKKCFISHSYRDAEPRQHLLSLLPRGVEPLVFPPIMVPPEQMVSDKLLDAIRACEGLIYLEGGASAESFWVALERDYALRMGKAVYRFDTVDGSIKRDHSCPLELDVFIASSHFDRDEVRVVLEALRERYFSLRFDNWNVPREGEGNSATYEQQQQIAAHRIAGEIRDAIHGVGYVLMFWSAAAATSKWMEYHFDVGSQEDSRRILFALLDDTPVGKGLVGLGLVPPIPVPDVEHILDYERDYRDALRHTVQVYGDVERSQMHRIDDLIVRLYWLIYRNTRQNQLS